MGKTSQLTYGRSKTKDREMLWVRGPKGVVSFSCITYPESEETKRYGLDPFNLWLYEGKWFMPVDLGFHHVNPSNEQKEYLSHFEECELMSGLPCWYDGTTLGAMEVFKEWADKRNFEPGWLENYITAVYDDNWS